MHYEPWTDERMLGVCVILSFDCKMSHQMQSEKKKKTQIVAMWKIKERKEHFRPVIKDDKKKRK